MSDERRCKFVMSTPYAATGETRCAYTARHGSQFCTHHERVIARKQRDALPQTPRGGVFLRSRQPQHATR